MKRIKELESRLQVTLFLRSCRGMTLTDEGKALHWYCLATQEAEGILLSQISNQRDHEVSLTILGPTSTISTRIAQNCVSLYKKFPFLRLHLRSEYHANIVELVKKKGKPTLALFLSRWFPNEMESKLLKPDRYFLVGSAEWKERSLADIIQSEHIVDFYEDDSTTINYLKHFK